MSLSVDVVKDLSGSQPAVASTSRWRRHDTHWAISLFGTAVGAGILFLPINLGLGGIWPLIIVAVLAGPMTFLAHRGLARFVLSSSREGLSVSMRVLSTKNERWLLVRRRAARGRGDRLAAAGSLSGPVPMSGKASSARRENG